MTSTERKNHEKYMLLAIFTLMACGFVLHGPRVLLLCLAALVTSKSVDILASMVLRTEYDQSDRSSELAALIFTLMLPVNVPFHVVIVPVIISIFVGNHMFGGSGHYPFNLAALTMCCAAVNWPQYVFSAVAPFAKVDLLTGYTTQSSLSNASIIKDGGIPSYSHIDMIMGNYPGVMGADFILVIIVIGVFMAFNSKISWRIPVSFLITCGAIAFFFPRIYGFSRLDSLQFEMLNGSVFYVALFMLCDPATTPKNKKAQLIYGVLTGILAIIFRYFGAFEIGTCFALLLVNTLDGYIDRVVTSTDHFTLKALFAPAPKAAKTKTYRAEKTEKPQTKRSTMDMISEAEDNLDDVIYSTRTIKLEDILKAEAEYNKAKAERAKKEGKK